MTYDLFVCTIASRDKIRCQEDGIEEKHTGHGMHVLTLLDAILFPVDLSPSQSFRCCRMLDGDRKA